MTDDTLADARPVPFGADGTSIVDDSVGGTDPTDFHRFTLNEEGRFRVEISGLQGDVDLILYDAQGNQIFIQPASVDGAWIEGEGVPPGTYYVEVRPSDGAVTPYRLGFEATGVAVGPGPDPVQPPVPPVNDDTIAGATQLQFAPEGIASVQETVGGTDPTDFYQFTLGEPGPVAVEALGAQGDVDLFVYDANGNVIGVSDASGPVPEGLVGENMPAGTYYVEVRSKDSVPTPYELAVEAPSAASGPVQPPVPPVPPVPGPVPGPVANAASLPESLALRDQIGLDGASAASQRLMERRSPASAEQLLASG